MTNTNRPAGTPAPDADSAGEAATSTNGTAQVAGLLSTKMKNLPQRGVVMNSYSVEMIATFAIVCMLTIAGTRAYLALTGYPQVGGEVFHLAHALWGGLALTITTLLLIVFSQPWARWTGAILGGVGAALFVDEVGKFITQKNDYFFPLAAPIVYIFLLLVAGAAALAARVQRSSVSLHVHRLTTVLDQVLQAELDSKPVAPATLQRLKVERDILAQAPGADVFADLVAAADAAISRAQVRDSSSFIERADQRLRSLLSVNGQRRLARLVLITIVLNGLFVVLAIPLGFVVVQNDQPIEINGYRLGTVGWVVATAGAVFAFMGAVAAMIAVINLSRKASHSVERVRRAYAYGQASLVIMLVATNTLMIYVDQFGTFADVIAQILALVALTAYTRNRLAELGEVEMS